MKDLFVAAIAIVAAVAGLAVYLVKGTDYYCPQPSAASVATLFAPCQAFDTAMGHKVTKKEAVQMGLLKPDEQPSIAPDKPPASCVRGSIFASVRWLNAGGAHLGEDDLLRAVGHAE